MKLGISRKYSFAVLGMILGILVTWFYFKLGLPEKNQLWLTLSSQVLILIITITYLTGQAKIDLRATYGDTDSKL